MCLPLPLSGECTPLTPDAHAIRILQRARITARAPPHAIADDQRRIEARNGKAHFAIHPVVVTLAARSRRLVLIVRKDLPVLAFRNHAGANVRRA